MTTHSMLNQHPESGADVTDLAATIDLLLACAQACTVCADACLAEEMVADMRRCIRSDQDCADICLTTARVLSRQTAPDVNVIAALLSACITACSACADECESHADMHEHCRACAEACRACQAACRRMLEDLG
jgi:hypothetical protein